MSLTINHNLMATRNARITNQHFGRLALSTARLSSGLRVNSAADDAAGLAIRELQRADIAVLRQGSRNANDAVSLLQTADGALGVIDEKLIRMKELSEQAATGTYDSVQRLIIHSEFIAMAQEINRIATATDFNGIHLLNGNLSGAHNGTGLQSTGAAKIHFGTANDNAEDYYYIEIGNATIGGLLDVEGTRLTNRDFIPLGPAFDNTEGGDTEYTMATLLGNGNVLVVQQTMAGGWQLSGSIFDPAGNRVAGPQLFAGMGSGGQHLDAPSITTLPNGGGAVVQNKRGTSDMLLTLVGTDLALTTKTLNIGGGDTVATTGSSSTASAGNTLVSAWETAGTGAVQVRFVDGVTSLPPTLGPLLDIPNATDVHVTAVGDNFMVAWRDTTTNAAMSRLYDSAANPLQNMPVGNADRGSGSFTALQPDGVARVWTTTSPEGNAVTQMQVFRPDPGTGKLTGGPVQQVSTPPAGVNDTAPNITQLYNFDGSPSDTVMVSWVRGQETLTSSITILEDIPLPPGGPPIVVGRGFATGGIGYLPQPVGLLNGGFMLNWQNDAGTGGWAGDRNAVRVYNLAMTTDSVTVPATLRALDIRTQDRAQRMLENIDNAIIRKDNIRAHLGALQNRLENTISNLNIQAENLQVAESRISDVDVATEMTEFTRNQILSQQSTAMLAQANSLPKMAMQLMGG